MFFWLFLNQLIVICIGRHVRQVPPPPSGPPGPGSASGGPPGPGSGSRGPPGPPFFNEEAPVEFRDVLPPETFTRLRAIHRDISLNWQQRQAHIEFLMNSLSENVTQKLPLPGNLNKLPVKNREEMEKVLRNSNASWKKRKEAMHTILNSLPNEQRRLVEPLPLMLQTQNTSTASSCPGTQNMTGELRAKLEAVGKLRDCHPT